MFKWVKILAHNFHILKGMICQHFLKFSPEWVVRVESNYLLNCCGSIFSSLLAHTHTTRVT